RAFELRYKEQGLFEQKQNPHNEYDDDMFEPDVKTGELGFNPFDQKQNNMEEGFDEQFDVVKESSVPEMNEVFEGEYQQKLHSLLQGCQELQFKALVTNAMQILVKFSGDNDLVKATYKLLNNLVKLADAVGEAKNVVVGDKTEKMSLISYAGNVIDRQAKVSIKLTAYSLASSKYMSFSQKSKSETYFEAIPKLSQEQMEQSEKEYQETGVFKALNV
ncbi:unnamed protein product, partial [marine sediment metagenome]